jgi:hypothetical protein
VVSVSRNYWNEIMNHGFGGKIVIRNDDLHSVVGTQGLDSRTWRRKDTELYCMHLIGIGMD